jgi:hypothetical protein
MLEMSNLDDLSPTTTNDIDLEEGLPHPKTSSSISTLESKIQPQSQSQSQLRTPPEI